MSETIYKAEYLMPGSLFPEETTVTLDAYDAEEALSKAPEGAFCFTLYEVTSPPPDLGPEFKVLPVARNRSSRYYIGGEVFTLAEVDAMGEDKRILAANMRGNKWEHIIHCHTGNWQPFEDGDTLLPEPEAAAST